jgi:succinyl-diaminopimelate desuccinylase
MKGGLAVMLGALRSAPAGSVDVTWVFYAREEVAAEHSGLAELVRECPDLLTGDAAILGEPSSGQVEAGCQGTLRMVVRLAGERAHSARPWMGRNAVHRLGALLAAIDRAPLRRPVIDGCEFRESLQAVGVGGGARSNVVPDAAELVVNHRFAPDRCGAEAVAWLRSLFDAHLESGDEFEVDDLAEGALPMLDHPLLRPLVERYGLEVRAKLGWTDVARFASIGVPAVNLGPGDPAVAHSAGERVAVAEIVAVSSIVDDLIRCGP